MEITIKPFTKKPYFLPLTLSLLIIFTLFFTTPFHQTNILLSKSKTHQNPVFVESKLKILPINPKSSKTPKLAYLISGSSGDIESLKRTLKALYHPLNQYVLHLDLESPAEERLELINFVNNEIIFQEIGNVKVVTRSNLVTYRGPTMVTNTLHAASILLKDCGYWDWFINLSASDYPLVTQDGMYVCYGSRFWFIFQSGISSNTCDSLWFYVFLTDLLHTFSSVPRDLNFIEHTSDIGWKEYVDLLLIYIYIYIFHY